MASENKTTCTGLGRGFFAMPRPPKNAHAKESMISRTKIAVGSWVSSAASRVTVMSNIALSAGTSSNVARVSGDAAAAARASVQILRCSCVRAGVDRPSRRSDPEAFS